ncbi:ribosome 60S biogenesis N-terminal-domain-containing protein [Umbelopsis sp. AD052]|nr:ribosome 60S biogenesis N-terminal-domain-containing protein [Umbelopsis sp. AD052]
MEKNTRPLIEYLQNSQEGDELFAIWELQNQNNVQALETSILDVIKLFLDLCHSPVIRSSGVSLIRRILQQQLRYIYRNLTAPRIMLQHSTLRLLISMNSFSASTTRELLDTFNFQLNGFTNFCNYRRKESNNANSWKYDLRTSYVEFVLSFFKYGDASVKKDILQVKDLVSPIFKGLERDAYQLMEMILSVMYEHFIMDQDVARTVKVSLFNNYVLDQLAKVYARQDPDASSPTEADIPANLVHHFLISICCTPGVGVCFHDAGWYPPSILDGGKKSGGDDIKIRNKMLGHFIKGLRVSEDLRQQELLVKVLKACPELVQGYWQSSSLTFEPRLSSNWLANMAILQKVLSCPPPSLLLGKLQFYPTTAPSHLVIADNILPTCISRTALSKGLQHSSGLVRYMTILTLTASMKKLSLVTSDIQKVIEAFDIDESSALPNQHTEKMQKERNVAAHNWKNCLRKVQDELCRRLPGVQLLATLYSSAITPAKPESQETGVDTAEEKGFMQDSILRLIVLCQKCLPEVMAEAKFDFSNFMPSNLSAVKPMAQVHLLELLMTLNDFRWSNKPAGSTKSHLHGLLTLLLSTPNKHVETLTRKLLVKTLSDTFMFNNDLQEIELWLDSLPRNEATEDVTMVEHELSAHQDIILTYLDDSINRFMKSQYKYMDAALEIVQKTNTSILEADASEDDSSLAQNIVSQGAASEVQPFSPLLITIMEQFGFVKEGKDAVARFIHNLFLKLEGKQLVPGYLLNAYNQYLTKHLEQDIQLNDFRSATEWNSQYMLASISVTLRRSSTVPRDTRLSLVKDKALPSLDSYEKVLDVLPSLPVDSFYRHFDTLYRICEQSSRRGRYTPLTTYMEQRHPAVGTVLQFYTLYNSSDAVYKLLQQLSFEYLFQNVDTKGISTPRVLSLLQQSVAGLHGYQLVSAARRILLLLTNCQKNTTDLSGCVKSCLTLLDSVLTKARSETDRRLVNSLIRTIFKHPVLVDSFLDVSKENGGSTISDDIQTLVIDHLIKLEDIREDTFDTKELQLPYIIQVTTYTLDILSECQRSTTSNDLLTDTLVQRVHLFCNFLGKNDLLSIVKALLALYHSKAKSKTAKNVVYQQQFSNLLTTTAVELCKRLDDLSSFEDELLTALFAMWQTHPTKDLDHLIANIMEWATIPQFVDNATIDVDIFRSNEKRIFVQKPKFISAGAVNVLMDSMNNDRSRILATLLKYRMDCRAVFIKYLDKHDVRKTVTLDQMAPLMLSLLVGMKASDVSQPSDDENQHALKDKAIKNFLKMYEQPLLSTVFSTKASISHDDNLQASNVLCEIANAQSLPDLRSTFLTWCRKPNVDMISSGVTRVFSRLLQISTVEDEKVGFAAMFINLFVSCLTKPVKKRSLQRLSDLQAILFEIESSLVDIKDEFLPDLDAEIIQEYVLAVILDELENAALIRFTSILVNLMKRQYSHDEPVSTYLRNILEHSDFKKLTASHPETAEEDNVKQRNAICWLIYTLVQVRPSAIARNPSLLDPLLCSYSATTSEADQLILSVLHICEKHSKQSIAGKALLWGPGSDKTRQHHVERGLMYNNSASINESVSLLDPLLMVNTCSNFPVDLPLERDFDIWSNIREASHSHTTPIYDPAFIMPLLATMLVSGAVDCRKFVECNAVGMMLVSLSSNVNDVRKVGYMLLDDFYVLLQHATFREQKQIMLLLNAVKNTIEVRNVDNEFKRIPYIITAFASQTISILLSAAHFMYPRVNTFLLQRQLIDIEDIPLFYNLFNTSADNHKRDRAWILRLLGVGLHTFDDHRIYKRRHVYDLITAFFDSKLADMTTQRLILDVLWEATSSPSITLDLARNSGLLSWLHQLATSPAISSEEIHVVCSKLLLRTLRSARASRSGRWFIADIPQRHIGTIAIALLKSSIADEPSDTESAVVSIRKVLFVLQLLHELALHFGENHLTNLLMERIISHLRSCEGYLTATKVPSHFQRLDMLKTAKQEIDMRAKHSGSTDQDTLYSLYQLSIFYLLELQIHRINHAQVQMSVGDKDTFKYLAARAIPLGFGEKASDWMTQCINSLP